MLKETAQTIALQVLGWLAADEELFQTFLGSTGASAAEIAVRAEDADFNASILDFLLMNDDWIVGFCDTAGLAYTVPMAARMVLSGGEDINWT